MARDLNPSPFFSTKTKKVDHYKEFKIMADVNLHSQILEIIKERFPVKSKILILGSGEGALDQRLQDFGYKVWSSDIDDKNFKANTNYFYADFNNCKEMTNLSKERKGYFDLVLSVEIVEHIENLELYFTTVESILKESGIFLISTPSINSWYSRLYFFINGIFPTFDDIAYEEYGHINPMGKDEIRKLLRSTGFSGDIEYFQGGYLPKLWLSKGLKSFVFNILGFILRIFMRGDKDGWCNIILSRKK